MTPRRVVDAVYEALAAADWVLGRLGIRYVIMAGTLLGAMRHGGLIPWDDDADLGVCLRDEAAVRAAQPLLRPHGHDIAGFDHGLKIFPLSGSVLAWTALPVSVRGYLHARPTEPDTWVFSSALARQKWLTEYFAAQDFDELVRVPFGPLSLWSVRESAARAYLDRFYGPDWCTMASSLALT